MIDPCDYLDKKLLALARERKALWKRYWITVPLAEPMQRGWVRHYVLAEKIGNHKHRAMLQAILDVIGTRSWNKTADFRIKRRRWRKHATVELQQPLRVISASGWERARFPEAWKQYFRLEAVRHKRLWHPTYVFAHRGLFELKVEPNIITEAQIPDPEVKRRLSEIDEWIRDRYLGPRLDWLLGIRKWRWIGSVRKSQRLAELHSREMREALRKFPEVDPSPCVVWIRISLRAVNFSPV